MSRTSAMDYAKRRREEETTARDDLKNLIPAEHFHADVEGDGNYNLSTKVMKAAEYYIQAQEQEGVDVGEQAEGEKGKGKAKSMVVKLRYGKGKRKAIADVLEEEGEEYDELARGVQVGNEERTASGDARHRDMARGQSTITAPPSATVSALPEIQQLRQCARRLVAVAEAKAEAALTEAEAAGAGGLSEELKASMEKGSDLMIDLIKVIEQQGWSGEMKEKWEEERGVW